MFSDLKKIRFLGGWEPVKLNINWLWSPDDFWVWFFFNDDSNTSKKDQEKHFDAEVTVFGNSDQLFAKFLWNKWIPDSGTTYLGLALNLPWWRNVTWTLLKHILLINCGSQYILKIFNHIFMFFGISSWRFSAEHKHSSMHYIPPPQSLLWSYSCYDVDFEHVNSYFELTVPEFYTNTSSTSHFCNLAGQPMCWFLSRFASFFKSLAYPADCCDSKEGWKW